MLSYNKQDLIAKGFSTDIDAENPMPYSKAGYDCFYKAITYTPKNEDGSVNNKPFGDNIDTR
jgi:hypothetical protein